VWMVRRGGPREGHLCVFGNLSMGLYMSFEICICYLGEDPETVLSIAGKEDSQANRLTLAHFAGLHANEFGTQKESVKRPAPEPPREAKRKKPEPAEACGSMREMITEQLRAQKEETNRVELERLKEKVRSVAGAVDPNVDMLLYHLEALAHKALESGSSDTPTYMQLSREAEKHRDTIDVPMLALKILGGRAHDLVGAAVAKQLKAAKKGKYLNV
jgi:hypothetical protein